MNQTTVTRSMRTRAAAWRCVAGGGAEPTGAAGRSADDVEPAARRAKRSAPFDPLERGRIAVKIVTATGMEMTAVRQV